MLNALFLFHNAFTYTALVNGHVQCTLVTATQILKMASIFGFLARSWRNLILDLHVTNYRVM